MMMMMMYKFSRSCLHYPRNVVKGFYIGLCDESTYRNHRRDFSHGDRMNCVDDTECQLSLTSKNSWASNHLSYILGFTVIKLSRFISRPLTK
jgi:hypothetical protein